MESNRPPWTVGASLLGLILAGITAAASGSPSPEVRPPFDFPGREDFADPGSAQRFGWSISASETDPAVWAQLRGVGPVLARRIADRAALGLLRSPQDLLRVRGIGIKMASRVEPWIFWHREGPRRPVGTARREGDD